MVDVVGAEYQRWTDLQDVAGGPAQRGQDVVLTHGLDEVDGMLVVGLLCAGLYDVDADEEARPTHIS